MLRRVPTHGPSAQPSGSTLSPAAEAAVGMAIAIALKTSRRAVRQFGAEGGGGVGPPSGVLRGSTGARPSRARAGVLLLSFFHGDGS